MHVRPYLPLLLLLVAGAGAMQYRRAAPRVAARNQPALATSAAPPPPLPLGSGRPERDGPPHSVHGGSARRHRAAGRGPATARVLWQRQLGSAIEAQVTVSPDGATLYAVTLGGDLVALTAATGDERWRKGQGQRLYSAPTVTPDLVVFGRDGGAVVAVGLDGMPRWKLETEQDCDVPVLDLADGGFVTACGRQVLSLRHDGTVRAEVQVPKKVFSAPAATPERVVLGAQDGHVRALSLPLLLPLWDTALGADVDGGIALADDGAVFAGTDGGDVVKLDAQGAVVWRAHVGHFVRGALSVARNGDVLAGAMGPEPALVRLRGDTGEVRFRAATRGTGANEFGIRGGALEDDAGRLYFGAQDDSVYALESDGTLLFRHEMQGDVDAPLTLLPDGRLMIAAEDGAVVCLAP